MQYLNKREQIPNDMQQLMTTADIRSITISEIARKTDSGSIYYDFPSKNNNVCEYPEETSYIILLGLTAALNHHLIPVKRNDVNRILTAFIQMQSQGLNIPPEVLHFLIREVSRYEYQ